jgi:hypothetical protein
MRRKIQRFIMMRERIHKLMKRYNIKRWGRRERVD